MSPAIEPSHTDENVAMSDLKPQNSGIQRAVTRGTFTSDEKEKNNSIEAGELTFEEDTAGGPSSWCIFHYSPDVSPLLCHLPEAFPNN